MKIYNSYLFNYFFVNDIYFGDLRAGEKPFVICTYIQLQSANYMSYLFLEYIVRIFLRCQVSDTYTGRTLRAASHRVASHRIASRRIASRDPSGGPSNAHAPFLDSRLSGFSLRMVGDWPGVTPPYNGFTRPRRVLERKRRG